MLLIVSAPRVVVSGFQGIRSPTVQIRVKIRNLGPLQNAEALIGGQNRMSNSLPQQLNLSSVWRISSMLILYEEAVGNF